MSMGDVVKKYRELTEDEKHSTIRETTYRERIRNQLEKFYSNQFIFVTPNKREGTFIALNDIYHYIRRIIKYAKQEKEKATEVILIV